MSEQDIPVEFNIIPQGSVAQRLLFLGDPSVTGRISILTEIVPTEGGFETEITLPEGNEEQITSILEYLGQVFAATRVEAD